MTSALVAEPARPQQKQDGLFDTGLRDPAAFWENLARVGARVGDDRVGTPQLSDTHRPDAFILVKPVDAVPAPDEPPHHPARGLVLRRFRPGWSVRVDFIAEKPAFICGALTGAITTAHGPWRADGDWWKPTTWAVAPDRNPILSSYNLTDPVGVFLEKLDEAVRIRMVSDVPFGAFLSGGIDSSAIVALMARHSTLPIKTFSVGFAEKEYSENEYARIIAQQFSTDHHELIVSPDHMMSELYMLVKHRDAPVSEPADIPIFLLSREARKTVRMVLTGEGSDEFLGGYNKHQFERYVASYQRIPRWLRHALIEPLINALPYKFRRIKIAVNNMSMENPVERYPHWFGALSHRERQNLVKQRADVGSGMPNAGVQFDTPHTNSALRKILYFDQTSWLPDNLLERGDRMTMAASIEARMPFMDHELVAFISTLPDRYRVKKMILKEAMMHLLPTRILERPKVGFQMPVADWFRTSMREYLHEHLLGSDSKTKEYYSRAVMEQILKEHMQKSHNHEKLLWSLLNLEIWHRSYV